MVHVQVSSEWSGLERPFGAELDATREGVALVDDDQRAQSEATVKSHANQKGNPGLWEQSYSPAHSHRLLGMAREMYKEVPIKTTKLAQSRKTSSLPTCGREDGLRKGGSCPLAVTHAMSAVSNASSP